MNKSYYVYILASAPYGTLYTGVTSNLVKRVWEHKTKAVDGFTSRHNVHQLVYYEQHETAEQAMLREKQLKAWKRDWKINLIEQGNPHWQDLYNTLTA